MPQELNDFIDHKLTKVGPAAIQATKEVVTEKSEEVLTAVNDGTPVKTGGLKGSLEMTMITGNPVRFGYKIDYVGTNERGVPYSLIGRALNRGSPFRAPTRHIDMAIRKLKGMDHLINERFIKIIDTGKGGK